MSSEIMTVIIRLNNVYLGFEYLASRRTESKLIRLERRTANDGDEGSRNIEGELLTLQPCLIIDGEKKKYL